MMCSDQDIKIAGDKPSEDVRRNKRMASDKIELDDSKMQAARELGRQVAKRFTVDAAEAVDENESNYEMLRQRRLLLSFAATVGFERCCSSDAIAGVAQKSFLDTLKKNNIELYDSTSDTGAFSFYYLAYRRGSEIERRIGQTFAMLCSHDGDPIYQELGEALYCWFSSTVKKCAAQVGLI